MINGIDLLLFLIGIAIVIGFWVLYGAYQDWAEFDKARRRLRQLNLIKQHEHLSEREYRKRLQLEMHMGQLTFAMRNISTS